MSHTSVAFWKNVSVRPPSMNKRTSSCVKSFTTLDNNKVNCAQMLPVNKNWPQSCFDLGGVLGLCFSFCQI